MKYFSPRYLFSFSLIVWIVIMIIEPFSYDIDLSFFAVGTLIIYILSFYLGAFFLEITTSKRNNKIKQTINDCELYSNQLKITKCYKIILFLSLIGVSLKLYDLFAIKDFASYSSVVDFRTNYDSSNMEYGIISLIAAILYPVSVALIMLTFYFKKELSRRQRIISYITFGLFCIYPILRGGRTIITLVFCMLITSFALTNKINKINLKNIIKNTIISLIGISIFMLYTINIIMERMGFHGYDIQSKMYQFQSQFHLVINENLLEIASGNSIYAILAYTLINILWYFTHGIYQFILQYNYFNFDNITYGQLQFYVIFKLLRVFGVDIIDVSDPNILNTTFESVGLYTTFFGPVLIDFGYLGFLYCFIFGAFSQYSWLKARNNNIFHLMVYPYFASVILHVSFINMIESGMGLYFLFTMVYSGIIMQKLKVRRNILVKDIEK